MLSTFNVIVPTKPALTVTGSLSELSASVFNFKSLRTTSPTSNRRHNSAAKRCLSFMKRDDTK